MVVHCDRRTKWHGPTRPSVRNVSLGWSTNLSKVSINVCQTHQIAINGLFHLSGWTPGSQWSWFDVGPRGSSSHGHLDKLHISIRVGSAHLLVDSGRFSYDGTLAHYRESYGAISSGHNVLLLDGKQQVFTIIVQRLEFGTKSVLLSLGGHTCESNCPNLQRYVEYWN